MVVFTSEHRTTKSTPSHQAPRMPQNLNQSPPTSNSLSYEATSPTRAPASALSTDAALAWAAGEGNGEPPLSDGVAAPALARRSASQKPSGSLSSWHSCTSYAPPSARGSYRCSCSTYFLAAATYASCAREPCGEAASQNCLLVLQWNEPALHSGQGKPREFHSRHYPQSRFKPHTIHKPRRTSQMKRASSVCSTKVPRRSRLADPMAGVCRGTRYCGCAGDCGANLTSRPALGPCARFFCHWSNWKA